MDQSGNVNARTTNGNIRFEGSLNSRTASHTQRQEIVTPTLVVRRDIETPVYTPAPAPYAPVPVAPLPIPQPRDIQTDSISRDHSPLPARSPIQTYVPQPYRPYEVPPTDVSVTSHRYQGYHHESSNSTSTVVTGTDFHHHSPPVQHSPKLETVRERESIRSWTPTTPGLHDPRPIDTRRAATYTNDGGAHVGLAAHQQTIISSHQTGTSGRYQTAATGTAVNGTGYASLYDSTTKVSGRNDRDRRQTTIINPNATITTTTVDGNFEYSSGERYLVDLWHLSLQILIYLFFSQKHISCLKRP